MNFYQSDNTLEQKVGTLEQMLGQLLAEQMAANANGGAAAGMNVPVMPIIGGAGESSPRPFDIEDGIVVRCSIPCPIENVTAEDYEIQSTGTIYLHIDLKNNRYEATVDQTSRQNTASHAQFVLYEYHQGKIVNDCRPTALPLFALTP